MPLEEDWATLKVAPPPATLEHRGFPGYDAPLRAFVIWFEGDLRFGFQTLEKEGVLHITGVDPGLAGAKGGLRCGVLLQVDGTVVRNESQLSTTFAAARGPGSKQRGVVMVVRTDDTSAHFLSGEVVFYNDMARQQIRLAVVRAAYTMLSPVAYSIQLVGGSERETEADRLLPYWSADASLLALMEGATRSRTSPPRPITLPPHPLPEHPAPVSPVRDVITRRDDWHSGRQVAAHSLVSAVGLNGCTGTVTGFRGADGAVQVDFGQGVLRYVMERNLMVLSSLPTDRRAGIGAEAATVS
eukprot:Hpha_TRINITY_DN15481_c6_g13::TRINITY_DN15481_c6_g13_i1::g.174961::m.174961